MKEWTLTILGTLVCISLAANAVLWNGYRGAIEKKTELQIQFDAQLKNQEAVNAAITIQSVAKRLAYQRAEKRKADIKRMETNNPDWAGGLLPDDVLRLLSKDEDQ